MTKATIKSDRTVDCRGRNGLFRLDNATVTNTDDGSVVGFNSRKQPAKFSPAYVCGDADKLRTVFNGILMALNTEAGTSPVIYIIHKRMGTGKPVFAAYYNKEDALAVISQYKEQADTMNMVKEADDTHVVLSKPGYSICVRRVEIS